ncbi:MATE family efflux transporter [Oceaniglobus indicus]|uniref:MATE family efflux transporter n=1 Tax=Oceaniglobus indicus TaxID=2047749 RepID=UPI001F4D551F|nr:MATE family efflux transporter [Oceaniglobus indicus]
MTTIVPSDTATPRPMTRPAHVRAILVLGLPLVGSHLAQVSIGLVDAIMLGWYGIEELAAEVLGHTMFFVLLIFGSGFAFAVMPMVAQAAARDDVVQVRRVTRMGLWVSAMFAALAIPVLLSAEPILNALGQAPNIAALTGEYLGIYGWGLAPALGVMVLKSFLSALEWTRIVLWATLAGLGLNVVLNWLLIFGNWGFPEMGIAGSAVASLIVTLLSFAIMVVYVVAKLPDYTLFARLWRPDWEAFGQVFRLGWPIGFTNLAEVGLFAASSFMMGWLGPVPLAAHGIALQISSVTFMIHLGLSNAATVRAGNAVGRDDAAHLKRGAAMVAILSLSAALLTVAVFLGVPELLLGAFLSPDDPARAEVLAIGVLLLAAAGLFQLVDAAQVIALGVLRGMQDTQVPMVIALISYWGIGIPVSYVLGFPMGFGGVGVWLGLAVGLGVAGVCLSLRFVMKARALA